MHLINFKGLYFVIENNYLKYRTILSTWKCKTKCTMIREKKKYIIIIILKLWIKKTVGIDLVAWSRT